MRSTAVMALCGVAMVAGCLKVATRPCADGWVCADGFDCALPPAYCGPSEDVAACLGMGKQDFDPCASPQIPVGSCSSGVCVECSLDREGCSYGGWNPMTSPTGSNLHAIWVGGVGNAYAVGDDNTVLHYDGMAWSASASPTGGASLISIWGIDGDHLFVVSNNNKVFEYDRGIWSEAIDAMQVIAVSGGAANDVTVVGFNGTILHFDGATWSTTTMVLGLPAPLNGVWVHPSGQTFVVGNIGLILHAPPATYEISQAAGTGASLTAIWGSDPTNVYAVGLTSGVSLTILRLQGVWTPMTVPPGIPAHSLLGVWGSGPTDVFACGAQGLLVHYDGDQWVGLDSPGPDLLGIGGSSANDVFAVGAQGTIWHYTGPI